MAAGVEGPQISIAMLCYNHEKFVAEAVDGVLAQTYGPLDIVIIDDCSTDQTADIIAAKLSAHPRRRQVRFIRNPKNIGGLESQLLALRTVQSGFIVNACGDDVMLPEMVAEIAKIWIGQGVSLVTTNAYYIDDESNFLNRTYCDPAALADDSFETLLRNGSNACCFGPAIGFEREVYSTFGWPPSHLGAYDIMLPFYAYLLKGACFIAKPLLKYRVHSKNSSLSLMWERSDALTQLHIYERMMKGHLAHAVLMQEEIDRLANERPERYRKMRDEIMPLLTIQTIETAKKLVTTRKELFNRGALS